MQNPYRNGIAVLVGMGTAAANTIEAFAKQLEAIEGAGSL